MRVERPDRWRNRRSVAVDQQRGAGVVGFFIMPAEMDFLHAIERKRLQIWQRLSAVVLCRHENVVDVEQQPASGSLRYLGKEVDLRDRAFGKTNVSGWIFEQHLASKRRLHLVDMLGDPRQRLLRIGQR